MSCDAFFFYKKKVIPHPSADGASLNEEGRRMAKQLGLFIDSKVVY
jgi:hypothetical protein